MDKNIPINENEDLNENIYINIKLNNEEERLDELYQNMEIYDIKEKNIPLCKKCMYNKSIDFNMALCHNCNKIKNKTYISNGILLSSWFSSSMILGVIFSFSGIVCTTFGLCFGNIFKNIYDLYMFLNIKKI